MARVAVRRYYRCPVYVSRRNGAYGNGGSSRAVRIRHEIIATHGMVMYCNTRKALALPGSDSNGRLSACVGRDVLSRYPG